MNKALPNPGTYLARRTGMMVVEESQDGALLVWVPYAICAPGIEHIDKHMVVLGKKDGTLQETARQNLMKAFGWDGKDPFDLETVPLRTMGEDTTVIDTSPEFELADCYHDEYQPDPNKPVIVRLKAQWFNCIGGTQNMPTQLDDADKKKVRSKWLGKFSAAASSAPAPKAPAAAAPKPAASTPAPTGAPKPAAKGPPGRKAGASTAAQPRTLSAEEVWELYKKAHADKSDDENGNAYYAAQDELFPGRDGNLNPAEWGQVADKLGV